jgi:hypothetical protein
MALKTEYRETADRLRGYLADISRRYPELWRNVDHFRSLRGNGLPAWPEWCYLPIVAGVAIMSEGADIDNPRDLMQYPIGDASLIAALAAWRMTQGIYRFHPVMLEELWGTPISGDLPTALLYRLPEWCVYVMTERRSAGEFHEVRGFFAHLEWDANTGRPELRILLDVAGRLAPFVLHLTEATLPGCIDAFIAEANRVATAAGEASMPWMSAPDVPRHYRDVWQPVLSVLLYMCSLTGDVLDAEGSSRRPTKPRPQKTKKGDRLFQADRPTVWETGYRMGAALQRAREYAARMDVERPHGSPEPHVRKAHWHGFWTGPRDGDRRLTVKWLPPIPVGYKLDEDLIPTIRLVR